MNLPYRPNVCILIYNREQKLFLGERHNNPGIYQFPQGGVEDGGTLEENVVREIEEETGIRPEFVSIIRKLEATHQYDFAEPPTYALGKWRGQSQTFWLVSFTGNDSEINLNGTHPEFMSHIWCSPSEVRTRAEPRRRPGYEAPLQEVEGYFKSLKV